MKYTVPNWAQSHLAKAVGLDPEKVAVEMENETMIVFLQYMPHKHILVSKKDGSVNQSSDTKTSERPAAQLLDQMKIPQ